MQYLCVKYLKGSESGADSIVTIRYRRLLPIKYISCYFRSRSRCDPLGTKVLNVS